MAKDRKDRINRRNADPELLREYSNMRNKRRMGSYLLPLTSVGMAIFLLTFLIVMQFNISGYARTYILLTVTGVYLLICFTLMIVWSPAGKRLRAFGIIVTFMLSLALLSFGFTALMNFILF